MLVIGAGWAVVEGAGNLVCGFVFGIIGIRYIVRGQHRLGGEAYVTGATTAGLVALLVLGVLPPAPFLMGMGVISAVAFIPTVRKCWTDPLSEDVIAYATAALSNALSIVAAHSYSLGTIYLPVQWTLIQTGFCAYLLGRRARLGLELVPKWRTVPRPRPATRPAPGLHSSARARLQ
jgi:hypothetical protein